MLACNLRLMRMGNAAHCGRCKRMQLCNFLDWANLKLVYKRYASLYFICAIDGADNELLALDMIHHFVEVLDKHFSNVCELDLVFHFYKAYWLLDEVFLAGAHLCLLLLVAIVVCRPFWRARAGNMRCSRVRRCVRIDNEL
jgi:Clathrin adaptor complex small chain